MSERHVTHRWCRVAGRSPHVSGDTGRNKMKAEMLQEFGLKVGEAPVHLGQKNMQLRVCVCVFVLTLLEGLRTEEVVHCADCKTD